MQNSMQENNRKNIQKRNIAKKIGIFLFWLAVWQLLSWCIGNEILLAGPWKTAKAWVKGLGEADFYKTILFSMGRIGIGFLLGFLAGCLLGTLGYRFKLLREVLFPVMTFLKSVPVASFVVLLLIWWGSKGLSVAVVFIVVLPIVYTNVVQGLLSTDVKMLEMAKVFDMPLWNRFFYIYRPALKPFMDSCLAIALGMSWKSGVAAEVIGTPAFSIGEQMYMAKIYLDTAGLFAWTITVILISFAFEKLGLYLWGLFCRWRPACVAVKGEQYAKRNACAMKAAVQEKHEYHLSISDVSKSFDGKSVLDHINKNFEQGKIYCLMAHSGAGKTTLLRILAGVETADEGVVVCKCSMVFQEDRLAEQFSPVDNIAMVIGSKRKAEAEKHLKQLLPGETLTQPCATLSGGMKRRVSLVRAVLADGDVLLLDEPFAGLDEENKKKAATYLLKNQRGRLILIATHDEEDAKTLGGEVWRL